ncbi:hypothetical protein [Nostoc sp. TCL26-01]|uniref:hypothetical protein n=1 Tax=Nostoc sp. TCL26-01 TaxID=2576904 RepID=UPI0015C0B5C5|nr:hypothetical protein [Nostoc sp. TCL26-01]QLE59861.1 hypothetical protein FD725_30960 [Nostoc sp. TCL26-01]
MKQIAKIFQDLIVRQAVHYKEELRKVEKQVTSAICTKLILNSNFCSLLSFATQRYRERNATRTRRVF